MNRKMKNVIRMMTVVLGLAAWCGPANAEVRTETVKYRDGDTELEGFLAYDPALAGKRPGVLVVHEWWGLNDYARSRARQLAQLGYVAFALDMYGAGQNTADPEQARHWSGQFQGNDLMRLRAKAGLDVLARHELVDPNRVAAIGYCFGGTAVLQLAFSGAPVKCVVSFHGSLVLPQEKEFGQIRASILVCHGAADGFIPPQRVMDFEQAMNHSGADWQMAVYGGAKHGFTNPGAAKIGMDGVSYNPAADTRSWALMQAFFREVLEPQ